MEEEKKTTLNMISSFFKRGNKKQEACVDTTSGVSADTTSSIACADDTTGSIACADDTTGSIATLKYEEEEEDEWILLLVERRANVQQISIFLIVLGIVLICFNYSDVVFTIFGKESGYIVCRTLNLGAAFVITVSGLIVWDNTREN
ncbi:uncharacterized protein LOC114076453 [Solanum pennellii]|uniref:Uncharacterized protein LOC114076453 n=1 Tax=Solanum pennellii TaxID=28526 RepID=A0ABM1V6B9_SOLPN|nr:uncharacterized protein LOC114076453 [Solanum pennellii]